MRKRLLTAGVGIALIFVVLGFFGTYVLNFAVAVIAAIAVYELLMAPGYHRHKFLTAVCVIASAASPVLVGMGTRIYKVLTFSYIAVLLLTLLAQHRKIQFGQICTAGFFTAMISLSACTMVMIRDDYPAHGLLYFVMALCTAWITDTGAFFTGRMLGKHKLAPEISPNKTVEGMIGGVISCVVALVGISWGYHQLMLSRGVAVNFSYIHVGIVALLSSCAAVLGDLFFSIIKRQTGVKDFGTILPGHGGVLDRFDSTFFSVPVFCMLLNELPLIII